MEKNKIIYISITTLNNFESSLSIYYGNIFHSTYWIENDFLAFLLNNNKLKIFIKNIGNKKETKKYSIWWNLEYRKIVYRNKKKKLYQYINNCSLKYRRIKINVHHFVFIHNRIGFFIRSYKMYRKAHNGWLSRIIDNKGNIVSECKGVFYYNCRKNWKYRIVDCLLSRYFFK